MARTHAKAMDAGSRVTDLTSGPPQSPVQAASRRRTRQGTERATGAVALLHGLDDHGGAVAQHFGHAGHDLGSVVPDAYHCVGAAPLGMG